jgi:hypothetical protein
MRERSSGNLGLAYIAENDDYHIQERKNIARKNDDLRSMLPYIITPNALIITKGVQALGAYPILKKVKAYNEFTRDDDPEGHHNFGCFTYKDKKIFWTIVDHGGYEGYNLVLTVLLADEW